MSWLLSVRPSTGRTPNIKRTGTHTSTANFVRTDPQRSCIVPFRRPLRHRECHNSTTRAEVSPCHRHARVVEVDFLSISKRPKEVRVHDVNVEVEPVGRVVNDGRGEAILMENPT